MVVDALVWGSRGHPGSFGVHLGSKSENFTDTLGSSTPWPHQDPVFGGQRGFKMDPSSVEKARAISQIAYGFHMIFYGFHMIFIWLSYDFIWFLHDFM